MFGTTKYKIVLQPLFRSLLFITSLVGNKASLKMMKEITTNVLRHLVIEICNFIHQTPVEFLWKMSFFSRKS